MSEETRREPNAFTLGNPEHYDPLLAEDPVWKSAGGAVFLSLDAARGALVRGRFLPPCWFPEIGAYIPGAVYGMVVEEGQVTDDEDEVGARRLRWPAPLTGKIET